MDPQSGVARRPGAGGGDDGAGHEQQGGDDPRAAIRPGTGLVAAMLVNNEIGTIQPLAELGRLARDLGILGF